MSTVLRTLSGTPKKQKKPSFWYSTLVFPERGAPGTPKLAKRPQFLTLDSRIPAEGCSKNSKIAKNPQFLTLDTHFPWEGLHRARFSWLLGCAKLEKKRKAREREGKDDDDDDGEMMMRRWWWWDDDEMMMMMMMRWWWWWDDDDDDEMMMIGRRIPQEIFKRNPSQALSGTTFPYPGWPTIEHSAERELLKPAPTGVSNQNWNSSQRDVYHHPAPELFFSEDALWSMRPGQW